ncbi:MAG: ComEC/Rec2 family competence protein [Candidatus Moraniibacteriota bacterium]
MHKSQIFLGLMLGFLLGIFWTSFWSFNLLFFWLVSVMAIGLIVVAYKKKILLFIGLVAIMFALGQLRTFVAISKLDKLSSEIKPIATTTVISAEPEKKEFYQNLIVEIPAHEFLLNNPSQDTFKILIRTDLYRDFSCGEKIKLKCQAEIVKNVSDQFDYRMYLAKDKIYYTCPKAQIEKTGSSEKGFLTSILKVRTALEAKINKIIPEPQASLANGVLFGGGNRLSKELQNTFSQTGMTHIVAVSGYNVTIIAEYLMLIGIFFGLWRTQSFYFAVLGIFIFIAMIGFPSSALRAGLMGGLILWAIKNGRLANLDNAVLLAATIMLAINPLLLRWDIGFQLSFLATVGLIKLAPFWDKYFLKKYKTLGILDIILMTISAQLFVLPIILYNFHNLALISILANLLILPVVPLTMLFVFLTAIGGFISPPLSMIFGWLAYTLLKYEIEVISFLAGLKWASLEIAVFNWWGVVIWYFLLLGLVYQINKINNKDNDFK